MANISFKYNKLPQTISLFEMMNLTDWSGPKDDIYHEWRDYVAEFLGEADEAQYDGNHLYNFERFEEWANNDYVTHQLNENILKNKIIIFNDDIGHCWQVNMRAFYEVVNQIFIAAQVVCSNCKFCISKINTETKFDSVIKVFDGTIMYEAVSEYIENYSELNEFIKRTKDMFIYLGNHEYKIIPTCNEQMIRNIIL